MCTSVSQRRVVILLLASALVPACAQDSSPDRIVAEWMLRMGGSVILEGQRRPITDLAALPTSDFRLHTLNFSGVTQSAFALEDEMKRLPSIPHVKELYVNGRLWYDQPVTLVASTMRLLAGSPQLEKLVLSKPVQTYIPFDDTVLKGLEPLTKLQEVRVHQTRIPGPALAPFSLKHLDLNYDRTVNDQGMSSLKSMSGLSKLYSRGTGITDVGLKNLSALTNLTELDLADTGVTDTGLSYLAGLTKLRRLNLQTANVTDAGLDVLRGMTALEELNLYRTKVSNAGLAKLSSLKHLRSLDVRYSRTTGAGVRELLAGIPDCKVMFLDSSNREVKRKTDAEAVAGNGEQAIAEWLRSIGGKVQMADGHVVGVSLKSTSITDREVAIL